MEWRYFQPGSMKLDARVSRAASASLFVSARVAVLFVYPRRVAPVVSTAVRHSAGLPCSALGLFLSSCQVFFYRSPQLINELQEEYSARPLLRLPSTIYLAA